jgi:hypothetical protein
MKPGANELVFSQTADLSPYVLAIIAHHPTKKQLETLERSRSLTHGLIQSIISTSFFKWPSEEDFLKLVSDTSSLEYPRFDFLAEDTMLVDDAT